MRAGDDRVSVGQRCQVRFFGSERQRSPLNLLWIYLFSDDFERAPRTPVLLDRGPVFVSVGCFGDEAH